MAQLYKKFFISLLAIFCILLIGTVGFEILSKKEVSWIDAFYMTFITITTIGFGEIVDMNNNPLERIFTIIIAISGIGVFTYMLSNFTAFIIEDTFVKSLRKRKIMKIINKIKHHYIICGGNDIAVNIANELIKTKREFVLIDKNEKVIENFPNTDILFLNEDPTDDNSLLMANIKSAAGLFAVMDDDNSNLVVSFSARQLNDKLRIIAMCKSYNHVEKIKHAGADSVISPNTIGSLRIASEMVRPKVVTFLDTMLRSKEHSLRIEEIKIPSKLAGKRIDETELFNNKGLLIIAKMVGDEWQFNPGKKTILQEDDVFICMVEPEIRLEIESD